MQKNQETFLFNEESSVPRVFVSYSLTVPGKENFYVTHDVVVAALIAKQSKLTTNANCGARTRDRILTMDALYLLSQIGKNAHKGTFFGRCKHNFLAFRRCDGVTSHFFYVI